MALGIDHPRYHSESRRFSFQVVLEIGPLLNQTWELCFRVVPIVFGHP